MRITLAVLGIFFIGCSPAIRVYHEVDKDCSVGQYQTFGWAERDTAAWHSHPVYFNELNDRCITQAVNDLLMAKGYLPGQAGSELVMRYDIRIAEQSMLLPDPYGYMYGDYWMMPRDNLFRYREATLILDAWHRPTRKLIWRGWAVAAIEVVFDETRDPEVVIRSAVAKILDAFPPYMGSPEASGSVATGGPIVRQESGFLRP